MPKFRKKPIVIEATQYLGGVDVPEGIEWIDGQPIINTLEGPLLVTEGDWVITGIKGERYPCKPDIFAATYDVAE